MKLYIYKSVYRLEDFDRGNFHCYEKYLKNIANIIYCFCQHEKIVFAMCEDFFYDEEYEINRSFIKQRIQFTSKFWPYIVPMYDETSPTIIWYGVDENDIVEALVYDIDFKCALVENNSIEDATYILNYSEDDEFNSLIIRTKNEADFINRVLPKLEMYFGEEIDVVNL